MYFITTKRMLEVCFSAHPNIQYRTLKTGMKRPWKNHLPGPGYLFPALPLSVIAASERKTCAPYQRSKIIMPTQPGRAFLEETMPISRR